MQDLKPDPTVKDRQTAEHDLNQSGAPNNGTERLKKGRSVAVLFRCTPARKDMLQRLAMQLSKTPESPVSYIDTINAALDALDEKLRAR
jgi:hypothetical protein